MNRVAYIPAVKSQLEVKPAPITHPGPGEVLIRNSSLGINPIDVVQQDLGITVQKFPHIPGMDVAGIVEEVGEGVTRFQKGDRVAGLAVYMRTQNPVHAAFQLYTMVPEYLVSHIPVSLGLANACVLPLCLATAAAGLFEPEYIGLIPPTVNVKEAVSGKERAILIWGGSSTIGSCAIQLCAASGMTVLTTASPKNHQYVKDLGAHIVFDHAGPDVLKQLIDAATDKVVVGAYDTISNKDTALKSAEFLHAFGGGTLFATRPSDFSPNEVLLGDVRRVAGHPSSLTDEGELAVWMKVWAEFMGKGLESGKFRAKPDPVVIQGGLEKLQDALDLYRKGVSAAKIVVEV